MYALRSGGYYAQPDVWPNANVRVLSIFRPDEDDHSYRNLDPLTRSILEVHETYKMNRADWVDWYNWFSGKNIGYYIYQHVRERRDAYQRRQERAYYWNYVKEIVKLFGAFLFSKTVTRTFFKKDQSLAELELVEKNEFWDNVDLHNTRIDAFMRTVFTFTQIFNYVDVIVDKPKALYPILSEQDRLDQNSRPYIYYVLPFNATNWERDEDGNFIWYRWRKRADRNIDPFNLSGKKQEWDYITWTRYNWTKHRVTYENHRPKAYLIDMGENPIGEVPVVRFYGEKDLICEDAGRSFVSDIGKMSVAITNYVSLIEEDIYSKVLNLLVMEDPNAGSDILDVTDSNHPNTGGVEVGAHNTLLWQGQHPPFYLAPASNPGQFILEMIEKCIEEIYKISTLWTDTGIRESRSGVSYSYEFNRTNQMLADKAQLMEDGEVQVHKLYSLWLNEPWEGSIDYPDSYDVETLAQELETVMDVKKVVRSPTLARELEKRLARKALVNSTTQIVQTVTQEIDTLPSNEEKMLLAKAAMAEGDKESEPEPEPDPDNDDSGE